MKFLVSIDRSKGVEMAKEITSLAIKYHKKHKDVVVGMDMSGNMRGSKARDFFELLSEARAAGMKYPFTLQRYFCPLFAYILIVY